MIKIRSYKGIWFYGLSGSGKTLLSNCLKKKIKNFIILDGDQIRKYISTDLGYSKKDREIQISRIFGMAKIAIDSKKFPIISTVYFNKDLKNKCSRVKILPVKIIRKKFNEVFKKHKTYKNKDNVVGKDIKYEKFKTQVLINDNTKKFFQNII